MPIDHIQHSRRFVHCFSVKKTQPFFDTPPATYIGSHQLLYSASFYCTNKGQFRLKNKPSTFRNGRPQGSYQARSNATDILGAKPEVAWKKDIKCQICGKFNHEAFECRKRFDHAFTAPQLHNSLAAMQINENTSTTWFLLSFKNLTPI
ncbi:hypothetical protein LIER_43542 [Lithospermum erythrorhizon]|uniref:Uncharacterized protein n=1 Tax=Lithospermum erythrorhizon TaxID=34254 RepID=A0AAV3QCA2_LITER